MTDAPERIYLDGDVEAGDGMFPRCFENPKYASEPQVEYVRADLATPTRCAECDCEKGGADCNWIATPTPAMCCLGLTPEQCAHTPSSQCEGLRPAVKAKALMWEDFDGRGAKASAFYSANYLINLWNGRGQFEVSLSYPGHQTGYDGARWHDTLEAAKAAAQADYEARVMAALEPATPLDDPRVKALVEALKESERMLKHYGSRDAGGMAQIRAALSALEENK